MKKKRLRGLNCMLLLLVAVAMVTLTGLTQAFYTSSITVTNAMVTTGSDVVMKEIFNKDDLWVPGETKRKEVRFGNTSEIDQVLRFKIETRWEDKLGNDITSQVMSGAATLNYSTTLGAQWTKIGDYYYYNRVLAAKPSGGVITETDPVLTGVTFNQAMSNGSGGRFDYSDKSLFVTVTMEAIDVNLHMMEQVWNGVTFTQSGSNLTWSVKP